MQNLEKMKEILSKIGFFILSLPVLLNNIVINLVFRPIESFKDQRFKRKNFDFLRKNNGRNFFCYKNKESAENFIQKNIEPYLSKRVIFVNLNNPETETEIEPRILKILKNTDKFPCMVKFRDDNVFKKTISNELYNALFITRSSEKLMDEIIEFYELKKLEILH